MKAVTMTSTQVADAEGDMLQQFVTGEISLDDYKAARADLLDASREPPLAMTPIVHRPHATLRDAARLLSDDARDVSIVRVGDSQTSGLRLPGHGSGSIDPEAFPCEVNRLRRWLLRTYNPGRIIQNGPTEGYSRRLGLIPASGPHVRIVSKATGLPLQKQVGSSPSALTHDYVSVPNTACALFDFSGDELRIVHAKFAGERTFKVYIDDDLAGAYSFGGGTSWSGETIITTCPGTHTLKIMSDDEAVFRLIAIRPNRKMSVRNEGNTGKSTYHWAPGSPIYAAAIRPTDNIAIVDLGTNNRMATESMSYYLFKDQYRDIIAALQASGKIVILMTPFRSGFDYPNDTSRVASVGDIAVSIRQLAEENNLSVIDNYAASCMIDGVDLWHGDDDRLHHNEIGHQVKFQNAALALSTLVSA